MKGSPCFICGKEVRRQLGFNPSALTTRNKKILKSLRSSWTKSLCLLLGVTEERSRTLLQTMPYCLSCHELISNVDFMISTIAQLEGKLDSVKQELKGLLNYSYKVNSNSTHRQLLSQILSLNNDVPVPVKDEKEPIDIVVVEDPKSTPALATRNSENWVHDTGVSQESAPEPMLMLISSFEDNNDMFDTGEDFQMSGEGDDDPVWTPEIGNKLERNRTSTQPCARIRRRRRLPDKPYIPKSKPISPGNPCPQCEQIMFGKMELRRHMKQAHPLVSTEGNTSPKCQFCGKSYNSMIELAEHEVLHTPSTGNGNPFACVLCDEVEPTSVYDLQRHVLREHETGTGIIFKCDECLEVRPTQEKLQRHKKLAHLTGVNKSEMHQCPQCPFRSVYASMLRTHMLSHGEKLLKCEIDNCGKNFYRTSTLNNHKKRVHGTGMKSFPCSLCSRTFVTQSARKAHQIHHSTIRPFMCEICSATFKSRRNLATHSKVHDKISGTNIKLQRPRKARLSDIRLQNKTHPADSKPNEYSEFLD